MGIERERVPSYSKDEMQSQARLFHLYKKKKDKYKD